MENINTKPIDITMEGLKANIIKVINESTLPPYLLSIILKDIYFECSALSQQQLQAHLKEYHNPAETDTPEE